MLTLMKGYCLILLFEMSVREVTPEWRVSLGYTRQWSRTCAHVEDGEDTDSTLG